MEKEKNEKLYLICRPGSIYVHRSTAHVASLLGIDDVLVFDLSSLPRITDAEVILKEQSKE